MGIILVNALDVDSVRMLLGRHVDLGIPYGSGRENWPVLLFEMEAEPAFLLRDMYPQLANLQQAAQARSTGALDLSYARIPWKRPGRACIVTLGQLQQAIQQPVDVSRPIMFSDSAYAAATRVASCQRIAGVSFLLAPRSAFYVEVNVDGRGSGGSTVTVPVRSMSTFCPRAVSQKLGGAYEPQGLQSGAGGGGGGGGGGFTFQSQPPAYSPAPAMAAPATNFPAANFPGQFGGNPMMTPPSMTPWQGPWQTPPPGTPIY